MRHLRVAVVLLAVAMTSSAEGAHPPRVVIPPRVEEPALAALDAEPFPGEASKPPAPSEWKEAPRVRPTRVSERITQCKAYRIREWVRIHCDRQTAGARLLAGSTEGIALHIPEPRNDADFTLGRFVEITFPVRRGDRRVFETMDFLFGDWEGWGTTSGVLVEERWLPGAKSPEIALLSP